MKTHRSAIAISIGCTLAVAGCSSNGSDGGGASTAANNTSVTAQKYQPAAKLVPASVAEAGVLRVGVALGSPPDEFQDKNHKIVGWEVDVVRAAAQTMGLSVKFVPNSFDSLIPGLQARRFDAAIGQFGVTREREKVVDFVATLQSNQRFAARSDSDIKVTSLDDLCGRSVAVVRGARQYEFAKAQNPKCVQDGKKAIRIGVFNDDAQAALSLTSGRSDLYWSGATAVGYFVKTSNERAKVVGSYLKPNPLGTAMTKNSGMAEAMQAAVQRLMDDGTYQKIMTKWGLSAMAIDKAVVNPSVAEN
ncbi:ABC transporter substrate-binding protein [Streptomyces collinus]|uniref:ABC transporter substrate-binding protein n=1 Tax=Streptomyces collinus TaxID=42684 RepID=UPI003821A584